MASHLVPHDLPHDVARAATRKALEAYRARFSEYDPQGEWVTDDRAQVRFTVLGRTLTGSVDVGPKEVALDLEVPLVFRPFRSLALKIVEEEIRDWINKARSGEI